MSDLELTMMRRVGELNKEVAALKAENARLKAEVERLTKAIDLTIIDLDERHERQDLRAWEFAELLRKAKGVQS
jgi:regulator of replication initiation timing